MINNQSTLSKKQIMLSRLIIGFAFVLLGIFLLLTGTGVLSISFIKSILPSFLLTVGLILFVLAFIQKNALSLWLSFPFLICAAITIITYTTKLSYNQIYPLYIIIPSVSSFATAIYTKNFSQHIKIIIPFFAVSILFLLNSLFCVSWKILLPSSIITLGLIAVLYSLKK